ncbi:hypothetical protein [Sphingorhabdus sp.]|uniref:hypothetical protein n=1 Tax=Sphingorhabdus sp. TaxID=1902408 RepID=UPI0037C7122C
MISAVLAVLLALGGSGPCFGDSTFSEPFSAFRTPSKSKTEIGKFRAAKNGVVLDYSDQEMVVIKILKQNQVLFFMNFYGPFIASYTFYGGPIWDVFHRRGKASNAISRRQSDVFTSKHYFFGFAKIMGSGQLSAWQKPRALMIMGNVIGFSSFLKSGFNQPNANRAQSHSDHSRNAHNFGPPSGDFLRGQILFFALILTGGMISLGYAIWRGNRGRADPLYTVMGVLSVYIGAIGCLIL